MFGKKKDKDGSAMGDAADTSAAADKSAAAKAGGKGKPAKVEKPAKPAKAEKAAKAPKPAKAPKVATAAKAKSPKRKNTLAKGGPGFFAAHIEKLIMAGCLAAVAYLVYAGFSTPGYDTAAAPEQLERDAKDLLTKISQDHWEQISADPERNVEHDFANRAAEARRPTDPGTYASAVWDPKPLGVFEKRGDPAIFPPEQLVVTTINGAIAVEVPRDEVDAYEDLEDAEPIRAKQRGRDTGRTRRGGRGDAASMGPGGGEYGNEADMMGAPGSMMGTTGTQKQFRFLSPDYNLGAIFGTAGGAGGMAGMEGMGGPSSMMGGMGPGMMGPGGGTGSTGPTIRDGLKDRNKDRGPKYKISSKAVVFNAITGVVPHRKMVEEFLAQFQESGSFVPQRDLPYYMSFELQRVEVTGEPTRAIQEQEWAKVSDGLAQSNLPITQKWAVHPPLARPVPEVIDRRSYDRGLTMPIPPLLVRDYRMFSKHPAVNWVWDARSSMVQRPRRMDFQPKESTVLPGARGGNARGGAMGAGGMMGGGMMGGGYGEDAMGGAGYSGGMAGGGYDAMGGGGYAGGMGGYDAMGAGGYGDAMAGGYGGGYGDASMMGGGMMGGGMMGGGMMGGGMSAAMQPEFKMVRCYDMLNPADYAKVFRYRIRVVMRDPNYPENRMLPRPAPNTLKDEVWARVAPLIVKDDAAIKNDPTAMRSLRYTDWSQPSPPARVDIPIEVLVGDVTFDGPRAFESEGKTFVLTTSEPIGNVVATTMDGKTGARYAVKEEVRRGSVLADRADVELIVPSTRIVKIKKGQAIDARATIVDIRGGKPLAGDTRDDPLKDIGEMLILNRDGSVSVTNEFDDTFLYRMYTFADEHEASQRTGASASGYGGGMGGGYGEHGGGP